MYFLTYHNLESKIVVVSFPSYSEVIFAAKKIMRECDLGCEDITITKEMGI